MDCNFAMESKFRDGLDFVVRQANGFVIRYLCRYSAIASCIALRIYCG